MNTSWWRKRNQMDDLQKAFIALPTEGRYLLSGPPGCGKTNLLLLRAEVMIGAGEEDVLFITYTNALADFIRSGSVERKMLGAEQIKTFHSWAMEHIRTYLGNGTYPRDAKFDRAQVMDLLYQANQQRPSEKLYSAIFIDEAQDLTVGELQAIIELSDNICICGDNRQGIYQQDGMKIIDHVDLDIHALEKHFRMGQEIAIVADKLMPPSKGHPTLESTCNYNPIEQGESSAREWVCADRDAQFEKMLELIEVQMDAFAGDTIGIFCGHKETLSELRERFDETDIGKRVFVHKVDPGANFNSDCLMHVLTLHSSKGTEFRCVHIFGAEELSEDGLRRTTLSYTGVTRAKTALNVYRTGATSRKLQNAFAKKRPFGLEDIFPDD
ncbi:AAA family ATPase [Pseudomonas sp. sia0905]|nr:AAA family ATPase [Pseudomonas sp. sia0905]